MIGITLEIATTKNSKRVEHINNPYFLYFIVFLHDASIRYYYIRELISLEIVIGREIYLKTHIIY